MAKTYSEIRDLISSILQDSTNLVFTTNELDLLIPNGLIEISKYRPHEVKSTLQTTVSSKDLTLSSSDLDGLLWIEKLEYKVDQDPRQFRNFTRFGDVVTMDINFLPDTVENIYLYLAKVHTLTEVSSTLDAILEDLLADLVAARAAINKSRNYIGSIDIGAGNTPQEMLNWGETKLADTLNSLRKITKPKASILYSRSQI